HNSASDARQAALVEIPGGLGIVAGIECWAASQKGVGRRRPAVIRQPPQLRVHYTDLVAVYAIGQAAGPAGADQIVRAGKVDGARNVAVECDDAALEVTSDNGVMQRDRSGRDEEAAASKRSYVIHDRGISDERAAKVGNAGARGTRPVAAQCAVLHDGGA